MATVVDDTDHPVSFSVLAGNTETVYKTSSSILKAQSQFFSAMLDIDQNAIQVTYDSFCVESNAALHILNIVALPKGTPIGEVLAYRFPENVFMLHAGYLASIWTLLHRWRLDILVERFKQQIHERLFASDTLTAKALIEMENAIHPSCHESFFYQCAGIVLARRVFSHRPSSSPTFNESWDDCKSAVWTKHGTELRKIVTNTGYNDRNRGDYWTDVRFPLQQVHPDRKQRVVSSRCDGPTVEELD